MSRELTSTTKKIVAVILFFGIVGFIIQVVGVVRRNDETKEMETGKSIVMEDMKQSIIHEIKIVN